MGHPRLTGRRGQAGVGSHGRAVNDRVDGCRHRGIGNRGGRRWRHAIGRAHDRGLTITDDQGAKGIRSVSNADRGRPVCRRRLAGSGCRHPWLGGPGAAVGPGRRSGRCHRYPPSARARWPDQTAESRRSESASTDRAPPVQLASGVVRRLVGTPRCSVTSRHCVDGMGGRLGRRRHSTITVVGGGLGRTLAGTVQQVRHLQRMLQRRTPRRFTTMPHHPRPRKA